MVSIAKVKVIGRGDKVRTAMRAPGSLNEESRRRVRDEIESVFLPISNS